MFWWHIIRYFKGLWENENNPLSNGCSEASDQRFFYPTGYQDHTLADTEKKSKNKMHLQIFLSLTQENYEEQRDWNFMPTNFA